MIRKILATLITITLLSCSSGLEKRYEKSTKETDLNQVSEQISTQHFEILNTYITELENKNNNLNKKTYQTILDEALEANYIKQEKIEEEKRKEEKRVEEEKNKKILQEKTKLLCSSKWIVNDYAFQIEIPDESEENIQLAKDMLNQSMFFKDSKLSFAIEKNSKGVFVKGLFDEKVKKIFTGNNKRWKKYETDGTYVEQIGGSSITGKWEFIDNNTIKESRPSESPLKRNKNEFFNLEINTLNNNTLSFYEKEINYLNQNSVVSTSIVMKR